LYFGTHDVRKVEGTVEGQIGHHFVESRMMDLKREMGVLILASQTPSLLGMTVIYMPILAGLAGEVGV
jgi:hypothetical protein